MIGSQYVFLLKIAAGALGVAALFGAHIMYSGHYYDKGKAAERAVWQGANLETLLGSNDALALHIEAIEASRAEDAAREIETGDKIQTLETRIIERIKEVPVEKYIKVAGDCRIDHSLVRLRNDWAKGDSDRPANTGEAGGYISRDGTKALPGDFISDPP